MFHRIRTHHGTLLGAEPDTREIVSYDPGDVATADRLLVAYVSARHPKACFLIAGSAGVERLFLPPGLACATLMPLGLAPHAQAQTVSLYHPDSGRWLSAAPFRDGATLGRTVADRVSILPYERFTLIPMGAEDVPPVAIDLARRIDAVFGTPLGVEAILAMPPEAAPILEAVARLAAPGELDALARALLAAPEACRKLARLFPQDLFATLGLPSLAAWAAGRDAAEGAPESWRMSLGAEADALATIGADGDGVSLPYAVNALARRSVEPRRDVCVIATARNEGVYLLEWIAYHRALGIADFFLYSNDNADGSDELLAALARARAIRWVESTVAASGSSAQLKAYSHALAIRPDVLDFRWALIIDPDEYLVVNPAVFPTLADYVRWQEAGPVDAIALNWVFHGSGGQARWREGFIARRFPSPVGGPDPQFKTLLRPRRFIRSGPHHPQTFRREPFVYRNSSAMPHIAQAGIAYQSETPVAEYAWINHYYYKSTEEFLLKCSRNGGSQPIAKRPTTARLTARMVHRFMGQFAIHGAARADPEAAAPGFAGELAGLMALPGVAEALERVQAMCRARIAEILPMFRDAPAIKEAGADGEALLATLAPAASGIRAPDRVVFGPDVTLPPGATITRLRTYWGTVLFADLDRDVLGHGPPGSAAGTVVVAATEGAAHLLHVAPDGRRCTVVPSAASEAWKRAAGFERVPIAGDTKARFGLRKDGLFLCAEADGRVTLSRRTLGPWERFEPVG